MTSFAKSLFLRVCQVMVGPKREETSYKIHRKSFCKDLKDI